jgi:hypothetical protein
MHILALLTCHALLPKWFSVEVSRATSLLPNRACFLVPDHTFALLGSS